VSEDYLKSCNFGFIRYQTRTKACRVITIRKRIFCSVIFVERNCSHAWRHLATLAYFHVRGLWQPVALSDCSVGTRGLIFAKFRGERKRGLPNSASTFGDFGTKKYTI